MSGLRDNSLFCEHPDRDQSIQHKTPPGYVCNQFKDLEEIDGLDMVDDRDNDVS